jgi:hypothetical protein
MAFLSRSAAAHRDRVVAMVVRRDHLAGRERRYSVNIMTTPIAGLSELLRTMNPELHEGVYVFASLPSGSNLSGLDPLATFREKEGTSVIVPESEAIRAELPVLFRAAWISLTVHSDLQAVGLTAAFATALAEGGISCNVVAGAFHDHIFVPVDRAQEALGRLELLQRGAQQRA